MKTLPLLLVATAAFAHTLDITGMKVDIADGRTTITVIARAPLLGTEDPAAGIARRLRVRLDGAPFQPGAANVTHDRAHDTYTWTATQQRTADAVSVDAPLFDDTTVVQVVRDGRLAGRTALNAAHPSATVGETALALLRRFVPMGLQHILSGPDHVLFVVALVLAGGNWRRILGVVTAFSVAHSITLSLNALGWSSLPPRVVEPMIALSIVVAGLDNLLPGQASRTELRAWLAFGFGFFHGFGFAGALADAGLPPQGAAWSLAGFNLGVEIGQGAVVLAALPLLALVRSHSTVALRYASMAIAAAGGVWLVARLTL